MSYWAADPAKGKLSVRILFAAMGRQNSLGHAQFGSGELARILGKFDPETGTITPARKDTVSRAISEAKASGYIDPRSTSRSILGQLRDASGSFATPSRRSRETGFRARSILTIDPTGQDSGEMLVCHVN